VTPPVPIAAVNDPFQRPYQVDSGYRHGQPPGYSYLLQEDDRIRSIALQALQIQSGIPAVPIATVNNPFQRPYQVDSGYRHGQTLGYAHLVQEDDRLRSTALQALQIQSGIPVASIATVNNPFQRPYQVDSGYHHGQSPGYPNLLQDVDRLRIALQSGIELKDRDTQTLIDILVPRSAYEIDALGYTYRDRDRCGADLGTLMSQTFSQAETPVMFALIGLAIGPAPFDLWLIKNVLLRPCI
jgi:hypothetical protein